MNEFRIVVVFSEENGDLVTKKFSRSPARLHRCLTSSAGMRMLMAKTVLLSLSYYFFAEGVKGKCRHTLPTYFTGMSLLFFSFYL